MGKIKIVFILLGIFAIFAFSALIFNAMIKMPGSASASVSDTMRGLMEQIISRLEQMVQIKLQSRAPAVSQGDYAIKILSSVVPTGSYTSEKVSISSDCQPELFDPKGSVFRKVATGGAPAELYKVDGLNNSTYMMMINGWMKEGENKITLASPFDLTMYEFGCASTSSFVADITKNGVRQSLFTHINNFLNPKSISSDGKNIFMVSSVSQNGEWYRHRRIINVEKNTKTELPNIPCVSNLGFWSENRLITYSDYNLVELSQPASSYLTQVCVWNTGGGLTNQVSVKLPWGAAAANYLDGQIGLLPEDDDIMYTYSNRANPGQACYINLQDLNNQSRNKKIKIADANNIGECPHIKIDFSTNINFNSTSIPFTTGAY